MGILGQGFNSFADSEAVAVSGDFSTWTEVDTGDKLTQVSGTRMDFTSLRRDDVAYLYVDGGAGYFGNSGLEIDFDMDIDSETGDGGLCAVFLSNTLPLTWETQNTVHDGLGVWWGEGAADLIDIVLFDMEDNPRRDQVVVLSALAKRYYRIYWNGTNFRVTIHSAATRLEANKNYDDTLANCVGSAYRYFGFGSRADSPVDPDTLTGKFENVVINNRGA
jgi:hypothetical protein